MMRAVTADFRFLVATHLLSMYTRLVDRCFHSCVSSFRSKSLDKSEIACAENCAARFLKMTQRVGLRFAEHQAMQQKRATEAAGGAAATGGR